ncbi:uncharacterized protein DUF3950 [Vibrio sp. ES.051]|uniref:YlcI/YnfO family protein n=1 Tax=Vibrio sp. ES.051 TaxID=1761909 RepID=UPI000BF9CF57|nr:YlcI/YnfO family protein [Vibrio sp. ES.051]PFG58057.1 uncharacterized protein DUF3950 [Vibrio sp. ES.051]
MKKIVVVLNSNTNRQSTKKNIRFEHELLTDIEQVKPKSQNFSQWVKEACREKLIRENNEEKLCAQNLLSTVGTTKITTMRQVDNTGNQSAAALAKRWHVQGMYYQQIADRLNEINVLNEGEKTSSSVSVCPFNLDQFFGVG